MTQYTINYAGFDLQQQYAISAILDLADSALTCAWLVTENTDSDVVMINLDADDGRQILATQQQNRPVYRIILVADSPETKIDQYWFLAKKHHAPPSLKELTRLLNEVAVVLAEEAKTALAQTTTEAHRSDDTVPDEPPRVVDEETSRRETPKNTAPPTKPLYARNYFFGILLQARKDNDCRVIKLNKLPALYLSPTENSYYFSGSASELLLYCTATQQYLKETVITKQKLFKILKSEQLTNAQPLDALIVYAVIEASQGRLLEGHSAEQIVKLTQLPDTDKFPMLAAYNDIAEFLYNQPGNLFQTAEALQIPLSPVFDFYNVCYFLGYLTVDSSIKTDATSIEQKKPGTLGDFLKAFFNK